MTTDTKRTEFLTPAKMFSSSFFSPGSTWSALGSSSVTSSYDLYVTFELSPPSRAAPNLAQCLRSSTRLLILVTSVTFLTFLVTLTFWPASLYFHSTIVRTPFESGSDSVRCGRKSRTRDAQDCMSCC